MRTIFFDRDHVTTKSIFSAEPIPSGIEWSEVGLSRVKMIVRLLNIDSDTETNISVVVAVVAADNDGYLLIEFFSCFFTVLLVVWSRLVLLRVLSSVSGLGQRLFFSHRMLHGNMVFLDLSGKFVICVLFF